MPLLLGTGTGAGGGIGVGVPIGLDGVEAEDDDELDPELLDEDAPETFDEPFTTNAIVVVPGDLVIAFDPPHPVMEKVTIVSAAMLHRALGFNLIMTFRPILPAVRSK